VQRLLVGLAILAAFAGGFFSGHANQVKRDGLNLDQFWNVFSLIQRRYVHSVDANVAAEGAAKGLVESLGDPYSAYLPPSDKKSLDDELKGEFEGVGAELTLKDKLVVVVAPLAGSPAEAAGLKAQDVVLKVDDVTTADLTLNAVVQKIRGPKGTTVKLTVSRSGSDQPLELTIKRSNIQVKSVTWKMIDTVGYVEISQFGEDTVALAQQAVKELAAKNPKAMIIDLRNNPGGYLNTVAPIAGLFIPPSVVVIERYKDSKTDEIRSTDVPVLPTTPLYLLVNEGSASAAEILAGALQDYKRATLVGHKTFGKGSVQDLIDLKGGAALRITIAEWLTPNQRAINKIGIEPDVTVEGDKKDGADPILDKALDLAKK
jgi:carboxyl-terminal processing protease